MLAGLLFATHDAADRPDRLTATLPFGGSTLIEYQARQLIAAGASQIIVLTGRLTPELMGALNRIGRRGVAVDPVRGADEVAEKLHPLARLVMLADGLVTTDATVAALAHEGGDALLVTPRATAPPEFERVGGGMAWAGIARLDPRRVAEVAAMPRDYDPQSTLVRVAEAAGATHVALPEGSLRDGHGIEHGAQALGARGRRVVAATVSAQRGWFNRWIVGPLARVIVPPLVARNVPGAMVVAVALGLAAISIAAIVTGWPRAGLLLGLSGTLGVALGATLRGLRDEPGLAGIHGWGAKLVPAVCALALARQLDLGTPAASALTLAVALITIGGIGDRATGAPTAGGAKAWWGSPPAYLLIVAALALIGAPLVGLLVAALYAAATLAAAVELLRRQP
jgi:hypothetical protein